MALPPVAQLSLAQPTTVSLSQGSQWLSRYQQAWQSLPALPTVQFRQQVRLSGSQTFTATLDVLARRDGSWQAWVSEGNRVRLLDSSRLKLVGQGDVLGLYTVYVTDPEALIPTVMLRMDAPAGQYQVTGAENRTLDGDPTYHLTLQGEGHLRELWLDPATYRPRQALLFLSGVWGQAYALLTFTALEEYWVPSRLQVNLGYGFWTLSGLSRRTFEGSVSLIHDYQDYQLLPETPTPRFRANQPPVDRPPQVVQPAPAPVTSAQIRPLGQDSAGNEQFSLGLGQAGQEQTPIQEGIAAFNLTRPSSRNARTQIDTLAQLRLGATVLPLYLFQFNTGEPLDPIQPGNPDFDPRQVDPFNSRPPGIRIL
ncbi:MAG: hypothetical protein OHK0012_19740 [Synechococcales cyanobacterium]